MKKNPFIKAVITLLFITHAILFFGCNSQDKHINSDADPFVLNEPTLPVEIESQSTPDLIVFSPGEIPWVEENYGVVFHPIEEGILLNHEEFNNLESRFPLVLDSQEYSRISVKQFSRSYPEPRLISEAKRVKGVYTGFQWPAELEQDGKKVHMFECPYSNNEETEPVFFRVGKLVIECGVSKELMFIHVPSENKYLDWFECESIRYNDSGKQGNDSCSREEDRVKGSFRYNIFYWIGENPKTADSFDYFHSRLFQRNVAGKIKSNPSVFIVEATK